MSSPPDCGAIWILAGFQHVIDCERGGWSLGHLAWQSAWSHR